MIFDRGTTRFEYDHQTKRPLLRNIVFEEQRLIQGDGIAIPNRYYGLIDGNIIIGMLNPGHPDALGVFCLKMLDTFSTNSTTIIRPLTTYSGLIAYKDIRRKAYQMEMVVNSIDGTVMTGKFGINANECSTAFSIQTSCAEWKFSTFEAVLNPSGLEIAISGINFKDPIPLLGKGGFDIYNLGGTYVGCIKNPMGCFYLERT